MPKKISSLEAEALLKALSHSPQGESIEALLKIFPDLSRRTLQRRLSSLVIQKKIILSGRGRGTHYIISKEFSDTTSLTPPSPQPSSETTLSSTSTQIRATLHRPLHLRHPVGYNPKFLTQYHPNKNYYLTPEMRQHLLYLSKTPAPKLPAGTYARKILDRLLIDLSWNSSRLEGNSYSLLETERLLKLGETADGKEARDAQMILNHKAAIELLVEDAKEIGFNRYTLFNLHALLSENLLSNSKSGGRLRTISVGISGTVYQPLDVPQLIEEYFSQIIDTARAIKDPFEQAFFVMVHLPYLQPFEDVNKRVSRLAANIPLIQKNLCPLSFIDVPHQDYVDGILAIYELNRYDLLRDVFIWAYERSSARYSAVRQSLGNPDPFRLRYRLIIAELVSQIVQKKLGQKEATRRIQKKASQFPPQDQSRFIEVTETELMSLHEGNIARYKIRPSDYKAWYKGWK